jgi:hypothetical protein
MRIRIVRRPTGRIDGVPLDRFDPGLTYDVNASIATYLMASGYAQAVADQSGVRVVADDSPAPAARRVKAVTTARKKR